MLYKPLLYIYLCSNILFHRVCRCLGSSIYLPTHAHTKLAAFAKEIIYEEQYKRNAGKGATKSKKQMRKRGEVGYSVCNKAIHV